MGYLNCYTLEEGMNKAGISLDGIHKQCTVLSGWTIYEFDEFEWVEVPAGQELTVGDPDVTFVHWVTNVDEDGNKLSDVYLGMINAKLQFGYASTGQLLTFESEKHNYAVANWQEAHTAAPFVQENVVKPVENADGTYTNGSYDKVIYCADCGLELDRETLPITVDVKEVTVPGSDDSFQLEMRSTITDDEVSDELKDAGFASVAEISEALENKAVESVSSLDKDKVQVEEIWMELKVWDETTNTWKEVDYNNFPANGIEVVLPYPAGMNINNCTIVITHMFDEGPKAGEIEILTPTFMADGIHVIVTGCSPFSIVYQEKEQTPITPILPGNNDDIVVTSPRTGDTMSMTALYAVVALVAMVVVFVSRKFIYNK